MMCFCQLVEMICQTSIFVVGIIFMGTENAVVFLWCLPLHALPPAGFSPACTTISAVRLFLHRMEVQPGMYHDDGPCAGLVTYVFVLFKPSQPGGWSDP